MVYIGHELHDSNYKSHELRHMRVNSTWLIRVTKDMTGKIGATNLIHVRVNSMCTKDTTRTIRFSELESRRSDPYTGDELYDSIFGSYKIKDVTQTIGVTNLSHVGVILTCYIWVKNCMIRIIRVTN